MSTSAQQRGSSPAESDLPRTSPKFTPERRPEPRVGSRRRRLTPLRFLSACATARECGWYHGASLRPCRDGRLFCFGWKERRFAELPPSPTVTEPQREGGFLRSKKTEGVFGTPPPAFGGSPLPRGPCNPPVSHTADTPYSKGGMSAKAQHHSYF